MLRFDPRLWTLVMLPVAVVIGQEPEVAVPGPDELEPIRTVEAVPGPGEVDRISEVAAPEIPIGAGATGDFELPDYLQINNAGGEISGGRKTGIHFGGPVKISGDNGLEAFANKALLDYKMKTVTLTGDVSIYQSDVMHRGEHAVYHYEERRMVTDGMRASYDPIIMEAEKLRWFHQGERSVLIGENAGITTHDYEKPGYWLRASETRIFPDEKITFKNLKFYVGDVPVLWLPYLAQPLDSELGYHFLPGTKSAWGPYLLNTYGIMLGGNDGIEPGSGPYGLGVDLADIHSDRNDEITGLSLYYLKDQEPDYSRTGLPRNFNQDDRYKLQLRYRKHFGLWEPNADWRFDSNLNHFSDRFYLEDFEEDVFTDNPGPDYQVNDFYRSDSRLPEIALDLARHPLFDTPLLHEGTVSFSWMGERASDIDKNGIIDPLSSMVVGDPGAATLLAGLRGYERLIAEQMVSLPLADPRREQLRRQLTNSNYGRFHTYQQVSLPITLGKAIHLTPRAGAGYTRYTDVDEPADDFGRPIFHLGLEASMKFTRDFHHYRNRALGIDGLMHVFQPYVGWSYIDTDDYMIGDPAVDRLPIV